MNEIALSDDLNILTSEIVGFQKLAGQSIWEIGKRLKHIKENDLAHGQFMEWYQSIGLDKDFVSKSIKIAEELPNFETLRNLGTTALHLLATLPDEEKQTQLDRIENGDNPTVRELQEVRRQLKLSQADNERLKVQNENLAEQVLSQTEKVVEKEVVREVVPDDYQFFKSNYEASERNNEFYKQQNSELREEMKELERIIKEQQQNKASREELSELEERKQAISSELNSLEKIVAFNESVESFLTTHASLQYSSDFSNLYNNRDLTLSLLDTINRLEKWIDDIKSELPKSEIIEGE
ncbi:DUF3102 domain-containing protein [Streptococcus gallolyticus subsp. gallolyticus]|uniref:DUF3102 domain-containing protein n=1 Tax=Streptococcus gallolyticus TaxID=315405 RepID=UPI0022836F6D|nr:DUF3102 domain-containing protein [Streptococcus gallolyticus]MCY7179560.1 DUF3102 domain-containing protein [Streptococcus gallolyticus subsp. gallolyticus]